jgi:hypothetical protein
MRKLLGRAGTLIRDTVSGRRRLARYTHPDAHRAGGYNPDQAIANHYRPTGAPPASRN